MPKQKVAVTIDSGLAHRVDELVSQDRFRNRSHAFESALAEALERLSRRRLARECARLDPAEERGLAEEGLRGSVEAWPES